MPRPTLKLIKGDRPPLSIFIDLEKFLCIAIACSFRPFSLLEVDATTTAPGHYTFQSNFSLDDSSSVFSCTPLTGPRLTLRSVSPSNCLEEVIGSATLNPLCCPNSYLSELQPEAAVPDFH